VRFSKRLSHLKEPNHNLPRTNESHPHFSFVEAFRTTGQLYQSKISSTMEKAIFKSIQTCFNQLKIKKEKIISLSVLLFSVQVIYSQNSDAMKAEALFNEGIMLYNQQNYTDAISKFERSTNLKNMDAETYFYIGLSYKRLGVLKESIHYFSKAIEQDPSHRDAYGYRAYAYVDAEKYKLALADFDAVIELDSENICLYLSRGIAKAELESYSDAIQDYEYLLDRKTELSSDELTSVYFYKGVAEYLIENDEEAAFDFDMVVSRDSSVSDAFYFLGHISADHEEFRAAISYLDKCLEIDSLDDDALFLRAYSKYNLNIGDFGEADLQLSVELGNKRAEKMMKKCF
jgi:tetratricopeptide (TPR) repeat protein